MYRDEPQLHAPSGQEARHGVTTRFAAVCCCTESALGLPALCSQQAIEMNKKYIKYWFHTYCCRPRVLGNEHVMRQGRTTCSLQSQVC
jgi:hypothetical protein